MRFGIILIFFKSLAQIKKRKWTGKMLKHRRISIYKIKKILRLFCEDIQATKVAKSYLPF
jgi:hypothetical protein